MKNDGGDDGEEEVEKAKKGGKKSGKNSCWIIIDNWRVSSILNILKHFIAASDLKVSEMEDWADSEDEEMSDEPEEEEEADKKPKSNNWVFHSLPITRSKSLIILNFFWKYFQRKLAKENLKRKKRKDQMMRVMKIQTMEMKRVESWIIFQILQSKF